MEVIKNTSSVNIIMETAAMLLFPWQYQLLFDNNGKLVEILNASRFELFNVFPGQRPFLLTVLSTSRGNGGHQLFKISADTLENVYEGYTDSSNKNL